ncbi:MAG: helix-turn-helix domain-containing protein [Alphaproteobacteria bacterium]|jgi:transcriptional regulator with XRE-family HTH domain|nr:helix-turn-helix domain-containing protein [Alphaproteobacteria bacterium]
MGELGEHNRQPKDIDVFAGEQLKKRRKELGMSQKVLAESLGVTFQQVQKYEKGLNRIGASRLFDLCKILRVKPSYFFKTLNFAYDVNDSENNLVLAEGNSISPELSSLIKMFESVDETKKKLILDLLKSMVESDK